MNTALTSVLSEQESLPPKQKAPRSSRGGRTTQNQQNQQIAVSGETMKVCLCQANCPTRRSKDGQKPYREDLVYKTKHPCECLEATVDASDWHLIEGGFWRYFKSSRTKNIYAQDTRHCRWLHRVIMGAERGQVVDHIDGNPLNNTRANLRICTQQQNSANSKLYKNNKTGYKGVHLQSKPYNPDKPYIAKIEAHGKKHYLGQFSTAEEGGIAYDTAALHHFGEFACLNFPEAPTTRRIRFTFERFEGQV